MGSSCCKSDTSTADTELGRRTLEDDFFDKYPEIGKVFDKVKHEFPKPYSGIEKDLTTKVQKQGMFLGKDNVKIRAGYGVMLYDCGLYYIGMWQDNARTGFGYMIDLNGSYYKGEWRSDMPEGYGEYKDGTMDWMYKGKWKAGKKDGSGEEKFPDGTLFRGGFTDNIKNGGGKFFFQNGCYFKGLFDKDIAEGEICEQKAEDYLYKGPFKNNDFHGASRVVYYDQKGQPSEMYVGEFYEGVKHGYGEYTWSDGSSYKGQWNHGKIANRGVYIEGV